MVQAPWGVIPEHWAEFDPNYLYSCIILIKTKQNKNYALLDKSSFLQVFMQILGFLWGRIMQAMHDSTKGNSGMSALGALQVPVWKTGQWHDSDRHKAKRARSFHHPPPPKITPRWHQSIMWLWVLQRWWVRPPGWELCKPSIFSSMEMNLSNSGRWRPTGTSE